MVAPRRTPAGRTPGQPTRGWLTLESRTLERRTLESRMLESRMLERRMLESRTLERRMLERSTQEAHQPTPEHRLLVMEVMMAERAPTTLGRYEAIVAATLLDGVVRWRSSRRACWEAGDAVPPCARERIDGTPSIVQSSVTCTFTSPASRVATTFEMMNASGSST